MDIYNILKSKSLNDHYLIKYVNFIKNCIAKNSLVIPDKFEIHHICPKSSDLFPEYKDLRKNPWNKVRLTPRQHYIAHYMLAKCFEGKQLFAFLAMSNQTNNSNTKRDYKINSRLYEHIKYTLSNLPHPNLGRRNKKNSITRKNKVSCKNIYTNEVLLVSHKEFTSNSDLVGVRHGIKNKETTLETRNKISKVNSNRVHMINEKTNTKKFVLQSEIKYYEELGFVRKFISYDRSKYQKTCEHCKKKISPNNYTRWHGTNCKSKN